MASPVLPPNLADLPPDVVDAVACDAARDAHRVGLFLDEFLARFGLAPAEGQPPLPLPGDFLLELAAALRLLVWETDGIRLHLDAGLPSATQALQDAFRWLTPSPASGTGDPRARRMPQVLALFIERMAWTGRVELGVDVALAEAEEDLLVEVLADFLWAHRHDLGDVRNTGRGTP